MAFSLRFPWHGSRLLGDSLKPQRRSFETGRWCHKILTLRLTPNLHVFKCLQPKWSENYAVGVQNHAINKHHLLQWVKSQNLNKIPIDNCFWSYRAVHLILLLPMSINSSNMSSWRGGLPFSPHQVQTTFLNLPGEPCYKTVTRWTSQQKFRNAKPWPITFGYPVAALWHLLFLNWPVNLEPRSMTTPKDNWNFWGPTNVGNSQRWFNVNRKTHISISLLSKGIGLAELYCVYMPCYIYFLLVDIQSEKKH